MAPSAASRRTAFVDCVPQSMPRKTRRIVLPARCDTLAPGVVAPREGPRLLAAHRADDAAGEVIGLHVDPAEQSRLTRGVRRVVVRGPLEDEVARRAGLDAERVRLDRHAGDATGEELA